MLLHVARLAQTIEVASMRFICATYHAQLKCMKFQAILWILLF